MALEFAIRIIQSSKLAISLREGGVLAPEVHNNIEWRIQKVLLQYSAFTVLAFTSELLSPAKVFLHLNYFRSLSLGILVGERE